MTVTTFTTTVTVVINDYNTMYALLISTGSMTMSNKNGFVVHVVLSYPPDTYVLLPSKALIVLCLLTRHCPTCKKYRKCSSKFDIWTLPEVLVIRLKKWTVSDLKAKKLYTMVEFPI